VNHWQTVSIHLAVRNHIERPEEVDSGHVELGSQYRPVIVRPSGLAILEIAFWKATKKLEFM